MTGNLPVAEMAHAMPGRARLRISDKRGDAAFFASVATGLSSIAGVRSVEVSPLTGSVLIQHYGPFARVGEAAREAQLFAVGAAFQAPIEPAVEVAIDPKIVLAVGLGAAALWQMSKERFLPPAVTLLWYAARLGGLLPQGDAADGE